jgi:hypothetical protein
MELSARLDPRLGLHPGHLLPNMEAFDSLVEVFRAVVGLLNAGDDTCTAAK